MKHPMRITPAYLPCLLAILLTATSACKKLDLEEDVPACIETKIGDIQQQDTYNPPAEVWRWEVDGQSYYYFTSDCCDQFNMLYNEDCDFVCAPDGGITGNGDGNCPQWTSEPVRTLVWRDN
jgi:hypothetical protein